MTWLHVPPTLRSYAIPASVLEETASFLRGRGEHGLEAVVAWLGRPLDERRAQIVGAYVPEQVAYVGEEGVAVEVTQRGLSELISDLPRGVFVLVRVHSHPTDAFHSETDDANMLISHEGAISVVVPWFARDGISLPDCSVNELRHGEGWRQLSPAEVTERFEVT